MVIQIIFQAATDKLRRDLEALDKETKDKEKVILSEINSNQALLEIQKGRTTDNQTSTTDIEQRLLILARRRNGLDARLRDVDLFEDDLEARRDALTVDINILFRQLNAVDKETKDLGKRLATGIAVASASLQLVQASIIVFGDVIDTQYLATATIALNLGQTASAALALSAATGNVATFVAVAAIISNIATILASIQSLQAQNQAKFAQEQLDIDRLQDL